MARSERGRIYIRVYAQRRGIVDLSFGNKEEERNFLGDYRVRVFRTRRGRWVINIICSLWR